MPAGVDNDHCAGKVEIDPQKGWRMTAGQGGVNLNGRRGGE